MRFSCGEKLWQLAVGAGSRPVRAEAVYVRRLVRLWLGLPGVCLCGDRVARRCIVPLLRPLLRADRTGGEDAGRQSGGRGEQGTGLRVVQFRDRDCHAAGGSACPRG